MLTLLALFALSLGLSILLTPLARALAGRWGLTDKPDRRRKLLPGVPWDQELISFLAGFTLLVLIPMGMIRWVFRQRLSEYGLGLPPRRWEFARLTILSTIAASILPFLHATRDADMRAIYPRYRRLNPDNPRQFLLYELCYLPFFVAIEFIFRGFLLFGLAGLRPEVQRHAGMRDAPTGPAETRGHPPRFFTRYAILIQMLSYTAWHLGKPLPELWGTFLWGPTAGALAYAGRSIWPVVAAHWLLNVALDAIIIKLRPRRAEAATGT